MKPEDIHFGDWERMFLGETPFGFFIEIILRVFFIYFLLMASMRMLGKRMASQLSRNELIAMVALAAAIGVPLLAPDRGLLPAVIIAVVVVIIGRGVARLAYKNQKFEHLSQDNACTLVQDSVLQLKNMLQTRITPERLFAELRSEGVLHLGEVKRLYIEANGSFTLVKEERPNPGLSVLPSWDAEFREEQLTIGGKVCMKCGNRKSVQDNEEKCDHCGNEEWVDAIL